MRKIKPYFDNAPIELWTEASKKRKKTTKNKKKPNNPNGDSHIELALSQKSTHVFDREVYGSTMVKNQLKTIYKCKCAFCETNTHVGAHKDVEHFRYKKHYYWLGYEWTNLLLSCQICNRDSKGKLFPLENDADRINEHPLSITGEFDRTKCHILSETLEAEKPLLLHPAIDNPKEHLEFLSNGLVNGLTLKGEKSIEVYGLKRDELRKARENIVFQMRKDIWEEYKHTVPDAERITIEIRKVINKLIARIENEESEYIGFATAILENFEAFIIDNKAQGIDMPDKDIMRQAVRAILNT
jgi:uncharacterized protein (TIGR02646 family)